MNLAIASDHAGYQYKTAIKEMLEKAGHVVADFGTNSDKDCDYPDYALPACKSVANGENKYAILVCGTGIGMSMVANKVKGIRCAVCHNEYCAKITREHNNANAISFGQRLVSLQTAEDMVNIFISTDFLGGKHGKRVDKISQIEKE